MTRPTRPACITCRPPARRPLAAGRGGRSTLLALAPLVALFALPSAAEEASPAEARVRAAAERLSAAPYRVEFEWTAQRGDEAAKTVAGHALVVPGDDATRFRLEATLTEGDGPATDLLIAYDGETVRVADGAARTLYSSPRHRAASTLLGNHAGELLPMVLRPEGLETSLRYRVEEGTPWTGGGRTCPTTRVPLPGGGGWYLSFAESDGVPCRFLFEVPGSDRAYRSELTIAELRPVRVMTDPAAFRPEAPEGYATAEFTPGGPLPGEPAPAVEVELAGGGRWSLAERRGRVVLVDFWATWCAPCRDGMREIESLLATHGDRPLEAIALNWLDEGGAHQAFLDSTGITYPWADGNAVAEDYGVPETGLPALFVVGKDGRLRDYYLGALDETGRERLERAVAEALAE